MARLLKYLLADGRLSGMYEGLVDYFDAQIVEDDPTYGYLEDAVADIPAAALFEQWYVVDEVLTPKVALTMSATPNPFAADDVTVCTITVSPFVPCTLLINGQALALTLEDTTVELTSDVPTTFEVVLQPMATHWALPMTVEAT